MHGPIGVAAQSNYCSLGLQSSPDYPSSQFSSAGKPAARNQLQRSSLMTATLLSQTGKINREELALVPAPPSTATHQVIPHHEVIGALVETLGFRRIAPVREEYAVSR